MRTGSTVTDPDGRYDFRFGQGIFATPTKEDPDPDCWQCAMISAHLEGHFEKNHNRQGDGYMSRKPTAELAPPWDDTWASGPLTFQHPGENDIVAQQGQTRFTARELKLKIQGLGVQGKTAVTQARKAVIRIEPNGWDSELVRDGDQMLITDRVMTWVLSNAANTNNKTDSTTQKP